MIRDVKPFNNSGTEKFTVCALFLFDLDLRFFVRFETELVAFVETSGLLPTVQFGTGTSFRVTEEILIVLIVLILGGQINAVE